MARLGLEWYIRESEERLIYAARQSDDVQLEYERAFKKRKKTGKINSWSEKLLHGQFVRQMKEVGGDKRWLWLKDAGLKRERLICLSRQPKNKP